MIRVKSPLVNLVCGRIFIVSGAFDTGSASASAKATSQKIVKFLRNLVLGKVVIHLKEYVCVIIVS